MIMTQLTVDSLQQAAPPAVRKRIDQQFVDKLNNATNDPEFAEILQEQVIGYIHILKEGKFQMEQYINACKYVSYKHMGDTNIAAYTKTFPAKYQNFLANGVKDKDIARYITAYNQSKLVTMIFEQSLTPLHLINQHHRQDAINQLAHLMKNAKSEKVQQESANSLLTHLKPPEATKVELEVGITDNSGLAELRNTMRDLAQQQKQIIEAGGASAEQIAHSRIIEGEVEDVQDDSTNP